MQLAVALAVTYLSRYLLYLVGCVTSQCCVALQCRITSQCCVTSQCCIALQCRVALQCEQQGLLREIYLRPSMLAFLGVTMYPMLMAGVSCTQSSQFFRRRVGVPFAASYSYSSLSSFSAKSIFRNPPCCVCNSRASSRPSSMSIGYRPLSVLSLRFSHASFSINPLLQLVATGRN